MILFWTLSRTIIMKDWYHIYIEFGKRCQLKQQYSWCHGFVPDWSIYTPYDGRGWMRCDAINHDQTPASGDEQIGFGDFGTSWKKCGVLLEAVEKLGAPQKKTIIIRQLIDSIIARIYVWNGLFLRQTAGFSFRCEHLYTLCGGRKFTNHFIYDIITETHAGRERDRGGGHCEVGRIISDVFHGHARSRIDCKIKQREIMTTTWFWANRNPRIVKLLITMLPGACLGILIRCQVHVNRIPVIPYIYS